jgi:hypothetical protein
MYELLLVLAVLVFFALKYRETFIMKYGNPYNNEDLISFDRKARGKRAFATYPDTCPSTHEEIAGVCYENCEDGYHGTLATCTADTINMMPGWIPQLKSRMEKRSFLGLSFDFPVLYQECPDDRDLLAGLCYKKCPPGWRPVDGLWHLCFKGHRGLSYGRNQQIPAIFAGPE